LKRCAGECFVGVRERFNSMEVAIGRIAAGERKTPAGKRDCGEGRGLISKFIQGG